MGFNDVFAGINGSRWMCLEVGRKWAVYPPHFKLSSLIHKRIKSMKSGDAPIDAPLNKWLFPAASGHQSTSVGSRRQFQFGLKSRARRQANQQVHAEAVDLSSL